MVPSCHGRGSVFDCKRFGLPELRAERTPSSEDASDVPTAWHVSQSGAQEARAKSFVDTRYITHCPAARGSDPLRATAVRDPRVNGDWVWGRRLWVPGPLLRGGYEDALASRLAWTSRSHLFIHWLHAVKSRVQSCAFTPSRGPGYHIKSTCHKTRAHLGQSDRSLLRSCIVSPSRRPDSGGKRDDLGRIVSWELPR